MPEDDIADRGIDLAVLLRRSEDVTPEMTLAGSTTNP